MLMVDDNDVPLRDSSPNGGWTPAELQAAYKIPVGGGSGKWISTLIGVHYPNAEKDLAAYREKYNLPPCTTANGCFKQIDENGGSNFPNASDCDGAAGEAALDIQMLSAGCPACKIMLIEPRDGGNNKAMTTAISMGVIAISFSWGEGASVDSEKIFTRPGIGLFAASGDSGYEGPGMPEPAALRGVVSVGGTYVDMDASSPRGWSDKAALFSGSGCSGAIPKPAWQTDTGCNMRMVADLSINGNNVANYCTDTGGKGGWGVVGGTSASSPLLTGALTAMGVVNGKFEPSWIYDHKDDFIDVTTTFSGKTNTCAGKPGYFCAPGAGYDGPTGWGVPNGDLLVRDAGDPVASGGRGGGGSSGSGGSGGRNGSGGRGGMGGSSNGGSGGVSGFAGTGGSAGTGTSGSSGSGTGGSAGSGIAGSSTGVAGATPSGSSGSPSGGGNSASAGLGNSPATGNQDNAGCSCSVGARGGATRYAGFGVLLFGIVAMGRRTRRYTGTRKVS